MGEEDQAVGLRGAEIKGDGSRPLGVPLGEADEGLRGFERNGVQGGHVLTLVRNLTHDFHLEVHDPGQAGQLQANVVVLVHHLQRSEDAITECVFIGKVTRRQHRLLLQALLPDQPNHPGDRSATISSKTHFRKDKNRRS